MMQELINELADSALSRWMLDSFWAWPMLEILHFIGLSILLGSLLLFDLRLTGLFRSIPLTATRALLPWAIGGFAINLLSGVLFFVGDPARYSINVGFQLKMLLIIVAGLNAAWFMRRFGGTLQNVQPGSHAPPGARLLAVISLVCWCAVLLLGRLIPYVGTG
jgi:hypothetical protein